MACCIAAWPSILPAIPFSAWRLASSTRRARSVYLKRTARTATMSSPPATSAARNCQPSRTRRTNPSSKTRFVLANSKEDGVGEGRALAEEASAHRDRGVGAARARRAEQGGEGGAAQAVPAQDAGHRLTRHDRLDQRGDEEAESQRPQHLPEHEEGHPQGFPDRGWQRGHQRLYTFPRKCGSGC